MPIQRRISAAPPPSHREKFARAYRETLSRYVQKQPHEYTYSLDQVPIVVEKMINSLANGRASLGPAVNAAARACGIPPTQKAIKQYLTEDHG